MKRLLLPLIAVVAITGAALSIFRNQPRAQRTEPPSPPPVAAFSDTVAAVGLIEASTENIAIGAPLAGVVEKVFVKAGDLVAAGAPLFVQETRHLQATLGVRQAALLTARAHVQTAETELADAQDQLDRSQRLGKERVISTDELMRRKFGVQTAEARLSEARAEIATAEAQIAETATEIERCTVRAPLDAQVLQVKVRAGEFAPAGQTAEPLMLLGGARPLHVRVDVDEQEGWRVRAEAAATAHVRGNAELKTALKFVCFEPMVVPKKSLTGASTERVDTRVLQVIYAVMDEKLPLFVGQQLDVFIEDCSRPKTAAR
jgi:multidrug efflux pump subunit AcrA (membrane-fusion protein)